MELVAIAKTVRLRGLRGELVAEMLTDFPERFENLERVFAVKPNGLQSELTLEKFWFQKDRVVLKFAGYDSIETSTEFINCEICVPESEAVELDESEFFDWDLEGCTVETVEGERIGTVREILRTGATELLVVDSASEAGKDFLIPFANEICTEVDIKNKLIRVDLPEGLLDF